MLEEQARVDAAQNAFNAEIEKSKKAAEKIASLRTKVDPIELTQFKRFESNAKEFMDHLVDDYDFRSIPWIYTLIGNISSLRSEVKSVATEHSPVGEWQ